MMLLSMNALLQNQANYAQSHVPKFWKLTMYYTLDSHKTYYTYETYYTLDSHKTSQFKHLRSSYEMSIWTRNVWCMLEIP